MLQRSPSYVLSLPAEDPIANALKRVLGPRARVPDHAPQERLHASAAIYKALASATRGSCAAS